MKSCPMNKANYTSKQVWFGDSNRPVRRGRSADDVAEQQEKRSGPD